MRGVGLARRSGSLPSIVAFFAYNQVRFGTPFESGYALATLPPFLEAQRAIGPVLARPRPDEPRLLPVPPAAADPGAAVLPARRPRACRSDHEPGAAVRDPGRLATAAGLVAARRGGRGPRSRRSSTTAAAGSSTATATSSTRCRSSWRCAGCAAVRRGGVGIGWRLLIAFGVRGRGGRRVLGVPPVTTRSWPGGRSGSSWPRPSGRACCSSWRWPLGRADRRARVLAGGATPDRGPAAVRPDRRRSSRRSPTSIRRRWPRRSCRSPRSCRRGCSVPGGPWLMGLALFWLAGRDVLRTLALVAFPPVAVEFWFRNVHLFLAVLVVLGLRRASRRSRSGRPSRSRRCSGCRTSRSAGGGARRGSPPRSGSRCWPSASS